MCNLRQNADMPKKLDLGGGHPMGIGSILNGRRSAGMTLKVRRFFTFTPLSGIADLTNVGVDCCTLWN